MAAIPGVTVDEFAEMPLQDSWELVDGVPIELSPSGGQAGWIGGQLISCLACYVDQDKIGWVLPADTGFILFNDRETVRSPDVAVVLRDRLPELSDSFVPLAPDLAVEVLSPPELMADALAKIAMYLDAGVRIDWLVDPASETVTVFLPNAPLTVLHVDDILDGGDILSGFSVPVAEIFN